MKVAVSSLVVLLLWAHGIDARSLLGRADGTEARSLPTRPYVCKDGNGCKPGDVIVRFKFEEAGGPPAGAGPPDFVLGVGIGLRRVSNLGGSGRTALYKFTGGDPIDVAVRVAARPDVLYAEPNYRYAAHVVPDDPYAQWPWDVISAPAAWDVIRSASDVTVGVIDTGIQTSHPDLDGKIDSTKLWHYCSGCASVEDGHGHGTHVAGTVGAETNNGAHVAGTAWGVRLAVCRFLDSSGSGWTSDAIQCINTMREAGVQITNNSWGGGGYSQALKDAIAAVCNAGGLFIASAGNDGTNTDSTAHYPSGYDLPCVMSIASTDRDDMLSWFSNYGETSVDMGAPGRDILSTYPTGGVTNPSSNGVATMSGTSMAAPHVAGAAALVSSASGNTLSGVQIKQVLMDNSDALRSLRRKTVSGGRLNLYNAVSAVSAAPPADGTATISCSATFYDKEGFKGKSASFASGTVVIGNSLCRDWIPMDLAGSAESLQVSCSCSGADCPPDAPVIRVYDANGDLLVTAQTECTGASCEKVMDSFGSAANSNYAMSMCFGGPV